MQYSILFFLKLGMDPTAFKRRRVVEEHDEDRTLGQQTEAEKYASCRRFTMNCINPACRDEIKWDSPFVGQVNSSLRYKLQSNQIL